MVAALSSTNERVSDYPNFFPAAQHDFAARMKWSVTPKFAGANHEPIVKIEGPLNVLASPGETIRLNGKVSDPDNNNLSIKWWQFKVGTYVKEVAFADETSEQCRLTIPQDARAGHTIHIVLQATDDGIPSLTRYQRVIITVRE